jgi:hypothetical protein
MPLELQPKLLRAAPQQEFERLGSTHRSGSAALAGDHREHILEILRQTN